MVSYTSVQQMLAAYNGWMTAESKLSLIAAHPNKAPQFMAKPR